MVIEVYKFHGQNNNQTYVQKQQLAPLCLSVWALYTFYFLGCVLEGPWELQCQRIKPGDGQSTKFDWLQLSADSHEPTQPGNLSIPLHIRQELKWKTMLRIIHSILTRENNPRVPSLAVSVHQSRENSKNVIKPSILTKKRWGCFILVRRVWTNSYDFLGVSVNKSLLLGLRQRHWS